jgi:uncharacterized protein with FMN-binding domain
MNSDIKINDTTGSASKKGSIVRRIAWTGAGLVLLFTVATFFFNRGMDKIHALEIQNANLTEAPDGNFNGIYCEGRWCYDLTVVVKEHKIIEINFNNDKMKMFDSLHEILIQKIIEKQRIDIDALSGATITSKAFLKAVENALAGK